MRACRMVASIYFYNELRGEAYEVGNIVEYGLLASEIYSKLIVRKMLP